MTTLLANELYALLQRQAPESAQEGMYWLTDLVEAIEQGHMCLTVNPDLIAGHSLIGSPGEYRPFILVQNRLYFASYWWIEKRISERLKQLAQTAIRLPPSLVGSGRIRQQLAMLFPVSEAIDVDWQRCAAALSLRRRLLVISGGPGTGKTTTVVKLMALWAALSDQPLVMRLAAPTGKAAARLAESVRTAKQGMALDQSIVTTLPTEAQTLHRLLGWRPEAPASRYHADYPLALDVLVVDEASMVDAFLMSTLLEALPVHARLVLLGDKDQLSSVENGAVFSALCAHCAYSSEAVDWLKQQADITLPADLEDFTSWALDDCIALLHHSYRFDAHSGIAILAQQVNQGHAEAASQTLQRYPDLAYHPQLEASELVQCFDAYWQAVNTHAELDGLQQAFSLFALLVAERQQVDCYNRLVEQQLEALGYKPRGNDWYVGRPILILENDYALGLFNGDIGFTQQTPEGLRVYFPGKEGQWRALAPSRLPRHETVYAMTVHKSQGSEFARVCLALPEAISPVVNRALIYTAITRAKAHFEVLGSLKVWQTGIQKYLFRASGLEASWRA